MEDKEKEGMGGKKCMMCGGTHANCGCSCCGGGGWHGGHHRVVHIIVKVLVLPIVFWLGMQFGALRMYERGGSLGGGRGGYMMGGYGGYGGGNVQYGPGPGMRTATTTQ